MTGGHDRPFSFLSKLKSIISLAAYIILVSLLMRFKFHITRIHLLFLIFFYSLLYFVMEIIMRKNIFNIEEELRKFNLDNISIYKYSHITRFFFLFKFKYKYTRKQVNDLIKSI